MPFFPKSTLVVLAQPNNTTESKRGFTINYSYKVTYFCLSAGISDSV